MVVPGRPNEFFDAARHNEPCLIAGEAPAFQPDWKSEHHALVRHSFGWPEVPRERRTRTAIEPPTGRAADERLFSYGLVLPETSTPGGPTHKLQWHTAIGLEQIPEGERAQVIAELEQLLAWGLPHIGKTRATAEVEWLPAPAPLAVDSRAAPQKDGLHVVTLQTEFLMTDPDLLRTDPVAGLRKAYESFWREASGGTLELSHYFASQSLQGGFQAARTRRTRYEPYLLTDRGSTFVLRVIDSDGAATCLATWREGGLPTPEWVTHRYQVAGQLLWRSCPFLPHVGHGEVAIDLDCPSRWPDDSREQENVA